VTYVPVDQVTLAGYILIITLCFLQDLVKSHLMFAVREEVEVLKEKIAELMDRINQLELENTILKAHASQETLAQLVGSTAQQGSKNQQSQQPPNGSMP
jgi:regulator of replication initiation timing